MSQWLAEIQEFDPEIILSPSTDMKVTDFLSRKFAINSISCDEQGMVFLQENDEELSQVRRFVRNNRWPIALSQAMQSYKSIRRFLTFNVSGQLVFKKYNQDIKLIPPKSMREDLIKTYHDENGHPGEKQVLAQLNQHYYWPNISSDVRLYIRHCHDCQVTKPDLKPNRPPQGLSFTATEPFQFLAMDLIGPLELTDRDNRFVLVCIDTFSKMLYAWALPSKESSKISELTENLILSKPKRPHFILTDNGGEFSKISALCDEYGIKHTISSPYHPQTNGCVERANQTLKNRLFPDENFTNWDLRLQKTVHAINCSNNAVTLVSPYLIETGYHGDIPGDFVEREPETRKNPVELHSQIRENIIEEKLVRTAKFSNDNYKEYSIGDKVLIKNWHKNNKTKRFLGPYTVRDVLAHGQSYELSNDCNGRILQRSAADLKLYHAPMQQPVEFVESSKEQIEEQIEKQIEEQNEEQNEQQNEEHEDNRSVWSDSSDEELYFDVINSESSDEENSVSESN
ncbi:MAG: DDE-type integrase/transposase/recombinase, partial [Pseudomonadota bacterium]|nr:DDE-type integrase/transposase/recombinase [Pseudomonadota bacterium]